MSYFWQDIFGKIFLARYFWQDIFGKRISINLTVKSILYKSILDKRFIQMSIPESFPADHLSLIRGHSR